VVRAGVARTSCMYMCVCVCAIWSNAPPDYTAIGAMFLRLNVVKTLNVLLDHYCYRH
jgi:hypothetical protein